MIFPTAPPKRLHDHNYKVCVGVHANLDDHGLVLNFKEIEAADPRAGDRLDEALLIPSHAPGAH
ncbi:MAG: 6-carboxytetrahydropterin synthase [Planctomycetes bacterium]|nr:6-carboxytetrahydropterin synthase [Planctomycetota bacterium]